MGDATGSTFAGGVADGGDACAVVVSGGLGALFTLCLAFRGGGGGGSGTFCAEGGGNGEAIGEDATGGLEVSGEGIVPLPVCNGGACACAGGVFRK
jgi:hypothetical protein